MEEDIKSILIIALITFIITFIFVVFVLLDSQKKELERGFVGSGEDVYRCTIIGQPFEE